MSENSFALLLMNLVVLALFETQEIDQVWDHRHTER